MTDKSVTTLPDEITDILCNNIDLEEEEKKEEREDMARDIVVFLTMQGPHYGSKLYHHFVCLGKIPPSWMTDVIPDEPHTPPMQCFAEAIARFYEVPNV